jgi:hypothetical protein
MKIKNSLILNYFRKEKPRLIWVVQIEIYCPNLNKMKSYFYSNLNRPSKIQRPTLLPYAADKNRGSGRVARTMADGKGARDWSMVH